MDENVNPRKIMQILKSEDGLKQVLKDQGTGDFSFAELLADMINIQRLDNKKMAESVGKDIDIKKIDPDQTAEVIQMAITEGNPVPLVELFNRLEEQRAEVLDELIDEEEHQKFQDRKQQILFTNLADEEEDTNNIDEEE